MDGGRIQAIQRYRLASGEKHVHFSASLTDQRPLPERMRDDNHPTTFLLKPSSIQKKVATLSGAGLNNKRLIRRTQSNNMDMIVHRNPQKSKPRRSKSFENLNVPSPTDTGPTLPHRSVDTGVWGRHMVASEVLHSNLNKLNKLLRERTITIQQMSLRNPDLVYRSYKERRLTAKHNKSTNTESLPNTNLHTVSQDTQETVQKLGKSGSLLSSPLPYLQPKHSFTVHKMPKAHLQTDSVGVHKAGNCHNHQGVARKLSSQYERQQRGIPSHCAQRARQHTPSLRLKKFMEDFSNSQSTAHKIQVNNILHTTSRAPNNVLQTSSIVPNRGVLELQHSGYRRRY